MKHGKMYREAVAIAARSEIVFKGCVAYSGTLSGERKDAHNRAEVQPAARDCLAQEDLIAELFGIHPDQVSIDVAQAAREMEAKEKAAGSAV